jgi:hypothetical protein
MTLDEYNREANDFTEKALKDLKEYCKSPDCNTWKVISRLRKPDRYSNIFRHLDAVLLILQK